MHRWHPDDLVGHAVKNGGERWKVLRLPAIAEVDDPLGRQVGDPLCPERYSLLELGKARMRGGRLWWDALYQQSPKGMSAGRVYERFAEENIDGAITLNPALPLHFSWDFNRNPGCHCLIGQADTQRDTYYELAELFYPRGDVRKLMGLVDDWIAANQGAEHCPEYHVYGDASGGSGTATHAESAYQIIRLCMAKRTKPVRLRVPRANPAVVDRTEAVGEALCDMNGARRYKIHPRCERLITDMREVVYTADGMIDKGNQELTHASDAAGYRIHYLRPVRAPSRIPTSTVG
jgi:hypothetical protein